MARHQPRIIIIGAGFGGLQAARSLARSNADVLLFDRGGRHLFTPLLYQVAAGILPPDAIAPSLPTLVRDWPNVRFCQRSVEAVDTAARTVRAGGETFAYDYLIVATGSKATFLGVPGAAEYALPLKEIEDAIAVRQHLVACFERAALEGDREWLSIVLVGGGTTGVEVAGSLAEWVRHGIGQTYPDLDPRQVQIVMLQSGDRLLTELPEPLGDRARKQLRRLGVEVYSGVRAARVRPDGVELNNGQTIPARTVIWTAGVEVDRPELSNAEIAEKNKLQVRSTLQLPGLPEVYGIGDLAHIVQNGKPLPGTAPVALQAGKTAAENVRRQLRGQRPRPFKFLDKGRLAMVGGYFGVGDIGGNRFSGFAAWLLWLVVHWVYLPGWGNRGRVLRAWLRAYLQRDRRVPRSASPYRESVEVSREAPRREGLR